MSSQNDQVITLPAANLSDDVKELAFFGTEISTSQDYPVKSEVIEIGQVEDLAEEGAEEGVEKTKKFNPKPYYITAGSIVGFLVLVSIFLHFFQNNLLYFPSGPYNMEKDDGFMRDRRTDVFFDSLDGTPLHAYWIEPLVIGLNPDVTSTPFTLIFMHGNGGNIYHRLNIINNLQHKVRCNVLMLSYRGYGKSKGYPSEAGIKMDSQAALNYVLDVKLKKPEEREKIAVYGQSLGGAIAIDLVSRNPDTVSHLIVENTFLSIPKLLPSVMPFLYPFVSLVHQCWESDVAIQKIKQPILFLSGSKDNLIPPEHFLQLYDLATNSIRKRVVHFPDGDHNYTWLNSNYFTQINKFLLDK